MGNTNGYGMYSDNCDISEGDLDSSTEASAEYDSAAEDLSDDDYSDLEAKATALSLGDYHSTIKVHNFDKHGFSFARSSTEHFGIPAGNLSSPQSPIDAVTSMQHLFAC